MKTISDTATVETRRTVCLEFTHVEIAKILLNHWHTVAKTTPLDMSVVHQKFEVEINEEGSKVPTLTVDFRKSEEVGVAKPPVPGYTFPEVLS